MTVGARLAAAREARGVSLEDLARRTRIPLSGLRALEAGAHDRLPPPIFTRGYIRACAVEIGLDPDALLAQFDSEHPLPPPRLEASPASPPLDDAAPAPFHRSRRLVSIAAAAGVIALVIWSGREPEGVTSVVRQPSAVAMAAPEPVGTTGEQSVPVPEPDGVSVVLTADRECWVAALADGERAVYRLMQAGEREVVQAHARIWLRIGDAGALTLSLNDSAPQLAGPDGAVRTLVFEAADRAPLASAQGN